MKYFHKAVLAASASAMAVLAAAPALAQDSTVEEVVVTGIRASLLQSIESKRRADAIATSSPPKMSASSRAPTSPKP